MDPLFALDLNIKRPRKKKQALLVADPAIEHAPDNSCENPSLKAAAMTIPSQVNMPFMDLQEMICNSTPCDESKRCTLWEVFSVPRLGPSVRDLGGTCRRSFDLKHYWDLSEEGFQRTLIQDVSIFQPRGLMLSPPCTFLCQLMHGNWPKMNPQKKMLSLTQGCHMVDFCCWLAKIQIDSSRVFAFEHPGGSLAWQRDSASCL